MRNGRPYMEDRTTACASFHDANIKKNALLTLSEVASDNEEEIVSSRPLSTGRDNEVSSYMTELCNCALLRSSDLICFVEMCRRRKCRLFILCCL